MINWMAKQQALFGSLTFFYKQPCAKADSKRESTHLRFGFPTKTFGNDNIFGRE
jgi:hypothetical protein